jgi:DNA-binding beta-propeller fold protein YncE
MKISNCGTRNDTRLTRLARFTRLIFFAAVITTTQPLFAATLVPQQPVELAGTHGKFDFIKVDAANRRLLACHTGNGSLDVIDLATSKLLKSIPSGAAQGVAIDDKGGRYFVSVSKPPQMVIIDATKLEATGTVTLSGPADVCAYSTKLNRVVVDNDDKPEQWIIDPNAKRIVATITMPGAGMEDLGFDPGGMLLAQNLKETNHLAWVDTENAKVDKVWSTAPAEKPHGLARVGDTDTFLIAGGNGKLVLIDLISGKILSSADIAPRVDEIAYDPGLGNVFCASGTGVISVVNVGKDGFGTTESVASAQGAHSIAVDPKTHTVWIVFAKGDKAYVQSFLAGKP